MYVPAEPGALLQFQLAVHEKTRKYCRKSDKKMSYTNVKQSSISIFFYPTHNETRIVRVDIKEFLVSLLVFEDVGVRETGGFLMCFYDVS